MSCFTKLIHGAEMPRSDLSQGPIIILCRLVKAGAGLFTGLSVRLKVSHTEFTEICL